MPVEARREAELRRFLENVEQLAVQEPPGSTFPQLSAIEGSDSSGTVCCVVDRDGTVTQVFIVDGWWTSLGPQRVGAAVLEALEIARQKAGLAGLVLRRHGHVLPMSAPLPAAGSTPPRELPCPG
jgi:hypothetical protein